jgi:hypothetical protein
MESSRDVERGGVTCIARFMDLEVGFERGRRGKPATGESMDKSTLAHTRIQIIIIHFLPSPIPPIPKG